MAGRARLPVTIRLTLVCHASTAALRASAFPADEPLDAQALRRLRGLASSRLCAADRHWTSPALRARETAAALGFDAVVDPLLKECDYGRWAGLTLEAVQAREAEAVGTWLQDPASAPHGGEPITGLLSRVATWLAAQQETAGRTVAVTHASVIRAAIVQALGAEPRSFWRIDIAPLSTIVLRGSDGRWTLNAITPIAAHARL